jgi:hypothetical protein
LGKKKKQIEWRRSKVLELLSQGYNQARIAEQLHVTEKTISLDVSFLEEQSRYEIRHLIERRIPIETKKAVLTFESMKVKANEILEKTEDPHVKLDAIKIINECTMRTVDIITHHDVVNNALSYVEFCNKKLNAIEKREKEKALTDVEVKGIAPIIEGKDGSREKEEEDNDSEGLREDNSREASESTTGEQ